MVSPPDAVGITMAPFRTRSTRNGARFRRLVTRACKVCSGPVTSDGASLSAISGAVRRTASTRMRPRTKATRSSEILASFAAIDFTRGRFGACVNSTPVLMATSGKYCTRKGPVSLTSPPVHVARASDARCARNEELPARRGRITREHSNSAATPRRIQFRSIWRSFMPSLPTRSPRRPRRCGRGAFFLKSAPAFLARTRWDSETGPTFCCALASLANGQSEGCGRGSGPASCHDPVQEENRSEADQYNCERGKSGLLVTIERHERKDLGGKRVEVEGPEQKRRRQLLHRIDEDEECGGAERGPEQGQMHFEQHLAQARAKRTRRGIDIARHPRQARLDRAERGGKETNGVGEHNGERGSR